MDGTPLPELPPHFHDSPSILGAYLQILNLERSEQAVYSRDPPADGGKRLIYTRILGYLILEGPSDQARTTVALEVNACSGDEEKLLAIGQLYLDHYILAFRLTRNECGTPASSRDFSRPSFNFETRKEMMKAMLVEAPQNHKHAKTNALVRDGFRCVISGKYEVTSVQRSKELELELERDDDAEVCCTECAHIFPESTNAAAVMISGNNAADKFHYASGVWAVLERFGYKNAFDELNGSHRLENIFTLDYNVHTFFNTFQLWLEPVEGGIPNTYKICAARPYYIGSRWKRTVTFTTPDPVKLPLPSPSYLELHAACCRVANLSGAEEYVDRILSDMEDMI